MQLLVVLAFSCLAVAASIIDEDPSRIHGENGWYVPQLNGSFKWMDMSEAESYLESMKNIDSHGLTLSPVRFYLYTKSNPKKAKKITASIESIKASNFNPAHPTRIIIHGWNNGVLSYVNRKIRDAWLSVGEYNIIVVDWGRARSIDYLSSVIAVPNVGEIVASMIDFLVDRNKMSLDTLFLIGHSLGAHVCGYAGKNVKSGKINTIIGLDPAKPLFNINKSDERLAKNDSLYVEIIHSNGGLLGILEAFGNADYYPNGGKSQPHCHVDITGACSHLRVNNYYAESIVLNCFRAQKCEDVEHAVAKNCSLNFSPVRMGGAKKSLTADGVFLVQLNDKSPYGTECVSNILF